MAIVTEYLHLDTDGNTDVIDITSEIEDRLKKNNLGKGIVTISVIGSTGALTTCEYEPGLVEDIKEIFEKMIPEGRYHHDRTWGDGNGHSHLRSSLVGPSLTIPFVNKELVLGAWQQIIFIDFDNRNRRRKLIVQIMGE